MKVKEVNVSANIAWSPKNVAPIYLACGTSAQQVDASFNSSSVLQLYDISLGKSTLEMNLATSKSAPAKFNKILWNGSKEGEALSHPKGILVGGCENGSIYIYSADKLLKNEECILTSMEGKHAGPVYALDFNQHQTNLLASGSSECEIIIWDINDPSSPMTPGAKPNVTADVTAVAWNRQVEHIMASTFGGRCVVYDLRKSTSIIQISESVSRIKAHSIKWHPTVATQLILGCNDDNAPYGQVWDLRFAAAPLKTLEGHQRGIMATAWCNDDPDLFITSAKDNKMFVWNPNNNDKLAEIVGEFPSYNQWSFDIAWSPRDPSLVATSSVDGTVSVYSILGGGIPPAQTNKFSAIADSFPGMEMPTEVPQTVQPQSIYLKRPPKWFPKSSGVSFGFGGRLMSWNATTRNVTISQVVTEPEFVSRSVQLEEALFQTDLTSYCKLKSETANQPHDKVLWNFIGVTFDPSVRGHYMSLLGFNPDQVATKVRPEDLTVSPQELADKMANLGTNDGSNSSLDPSEQFEMIASAQSVDKTPDAEISDFESILTEPLCLSVGEDSKGLIRHALLIGDYKSAVQLCLKEKKTSLALILAAHAGEDLFSKTRDKVLVLEPQNDLSPLVTSVVQRDLSSLVSNCKLSDWKEALVATLTYASDEEFSTLAECLGERLEADGNIENLHSSVLCFLVAGNLDKFVSCWAKIKPKSDTNPLNLQELVEIIIVLQRALTAVGRCTNLKDGSSASVYLCQYASSLASQGALSTAVSYLNSATQGEMVDLRERLYRALGYHTGNNNLATRNRSISTSSQQSYRRASTPLSYQPSQYTPSVQAQQASYGSSQPTFYSPAPVVKQPFMQPTAAIQPTFGSLAPSNQFGQQSPAQPNMPLPPVGAVIPPGSLRRNNGSSSGTVPQPGNMFTPTPSLINAMHPNTHFTSHFNPNNAPAPQTPTPLGSSPTFSHTPQSFIPDQPVDISGNTLTPAAYDPMVPRGWNDPPQLSAARRWEGNPNGSAFLGEHSGAKRLQNLKAKQQLQKQQTNTAEGASDLITSTMPAVFVPEPPQQFSGFHSNLQQGYVPASSGGHQQSSSQITQGVVAEPAPPKGPIPAEHQIIHDTFNKLREKGLQVTSNMTAKQRLEDLAPKLEILYDKLRTSQIGSSTTAGLLQIVEAVNAGDYHRALQIHSSTISSGNFSEMSQFMPPIKMLLTTCMQCQIFFN